MVKKGLPGLRGRVVGRAVALGEAGLDVLGVRPPLALLVLGHMRSGSTLLLHVLLTNPEISGLGERNATYRLPSDLARLALATRLERRQLFAPLRYVADQINHDAFTPDPRLLEHPRVRLLFLIRDPEATVASLLDLTRTHYEPWSVERAVDYYVDRLATLADHGRRIGDRERAAFLTYGELTESSSETLHALKGFLGTRAGFSERYGTHEFTGRRGDPSPNIGTGRIGRPRALAPLDIPASLLGRVNDAYARCRAALAPYALRPDLGTTPVASPAGGGARIRS